VATTVRQALKVPTALASNAIVYLKLQDLECPEGKPTPLCSARTAGRLEPLVLRANAGDCLEVTLINAIDAARLTSTTGTAAPNLPPVPQTLPPTFAYGCGAGGAAACLPSRISLNVGLHPQLVSYDVAAGDAFNAGTNPVQTVAPGQVRTYTWYAGNVDTSVDPPRYIPIEFGAANLLPSDVINHYQIGLFGALVIEPKGATGWKPEDGTTTVVRTAQGAPHFRELVLALEDGLSTPNLAISADKVNAFNYASEPLGNRSCATAGDLSCILSTSAQCGSGPCGDPKTPTLRACAGEEVRMRVVHPGGINTDHTFELYGHVWAETPYMSSGLLGCTPPTTHTNLYASSVISDDRGCTQALLAPLGKTVPLPLYGPGLDTLSEWQGFHLGHGPSNHFDVLIEKAGGRNAVPGDYLYRSYPAMHFTLGPWGIFRVEDKASSFCTGKTATGGGSVTAGGGGR